MELQRWCLCGCSESTAEGMERKGPFCHYPAMKAS